MKKISPLWTALAAVTSLIICGCQSYTACGHDSTHTVTTKPVTCTAPGETTEICDACGAAVSHRQHRAAGHSFGDYILTVLPTAAADGMEARVCSTCCAEESRPYTCPHTETCETVIEAQNCTEPGTRTISCKACSAVLERQEIDAPGHVFGDFVSVKPPRLDQNGIEARTCQNCETIETREYTCPHEKTYTEIYGQPSCREAGALQTKCSLCSAVLETRILEPLQCEYGEWAIIKAPTKTETGIKERACHLCSGKEEAAIPTIKDYDGSMGTAGRLHGRTVIVSVFADDRNTSWDTSRAEDAEMMSLMLTNLGMATEWISEQCERYDVWADFVYDWQENPDLYYRTDFGELNMVELYAGGYWTQHNYITQNIDSEGLKQKYNAQNIIYILYYDTESSNQITSRMYGCITSPERKTEVISAYARWKGQMGASPAVQAHEILHCFGAYDLYCASEQIPQAYVDHCENTSSTDIMYVTSKTNSAIQGTLSELDAYYLGLTDSCADVEKWGLAQSTHIADKY